MRTEFEIYAVPATLDIRDLRQKKNQSNNKEFKKNDRI